MENPLKRRKPRDTGFLKRKMFQWLGKERAYVQSVDIHEEEGILKGVSLDYSHSRQFKAALLEAELKKAKAQMEIERQRMRMF